MNKKSFGIIILLIVDLHSQTFREFDKNFQILLDTINSPIITLNALMLFDQELNKNLLKKVVSNIPTDYEITYRSICKYNIKNSNIRLYFLSQCCIENLEKILIILFDLKTLKVKNIYELHHFTSDEGWLSYSDNSFIDINSDGILDIFSFHKEEDVDGTENDTGFSIYLWYQDKFLIFYNDINEAIKKSKMKN